MADETPEQIRQRVHEEELGKGSDPRVAEGRAKAAEARAKQGLPIDPQSAWPAKMQREGGGAANAPAAVAPLAEVDLQEAASEAEPEPVEAPAPAETAAADVDTGEVSQAPVATPPVEAPAPPAAVVERAGTVAEVAPMVLAPPAPKEAHLEPEIGEMVEIDTERLDEIAGIKLQDSVLPKWLLVVLLVIPTLAAIYLLVFSGGGDFGTRCSVEADLRLNCFPGVTEPSQSVEPVPSGG